MKNQNHDLKRSYKTALELSIISALLICHFAFFLLRNVQLRAEPQEANTRHDFVVEPPPKVAPPQPPVRPPRPPQPVPSTDENLPENITIPATTDFNLFEVPLPPPPPDEDEVVPFWSVEEKPELIGGLKSIRRHVRYPEVARKIGLQGVVIVRVLVDETGLPAKVRILQSSGSELLDNAALEAVRKLRWKPARQRDRAVKVWAAIPVRFLLR